MGRIDERKTVKLTRSPGMSVDAIVSLRGVDLAAGPARIRFEQREPVEVVVHRDGASEQRICIPRTDAQTMAMVAIPLAAVVFTRAYKRLNRRSN